MGQTTMQKNPILLVSITFILVILACGQSTPKAYTIAPSTEGAIFTKNAFSVTLPTDWEEEKSNDKQVIYAVSDGAASLWIKTWPLIPSLVAKGVHDWVDGNTQASLLDETGDLEKIRLEIDLIENSKTLRLSSLLLYCDTQTYEVTGVSLENNFTQYTSLFEQTKASATCSPKDRMPLLESGALGMVILPKSNDENQFDPVDYQEAIALARANGVQVSHYYVQWGEIETSPGVYDWATTDYILEANALEGLQVSVVVNVIHTSVLGRVPPDLVGVAIGDSRFSERLTQFLVAFANRYKGRLHYLSVGNEVNNYFAAHPDEVDAYALAFDQARTAIHQENPSLPVGIVFAYHDAETQGTIDIIRTLNRGDFIAYTLYLYNEGFHFTREPTLIGEYLDKMLALAGGTPMAIVETGWSTAEFLEGSESNQAEYVRQMFAALDQRRDQIRFISWFVLHDSRREFCDQQALTFFEPGAEPNPTWMDAFSTFLCYFGLRHSDGTPKPAWEVWQQEVQAYYQ